MGSFSCEATSFMFVPDKLSHTGPSRPVHTPPGALQSLKLPPRPVHATGETLKHLNGGKIVVLDDEASILTVLSHALRAHFEKLGLQISCELIQVDDSIKDPESVALEIAKIHRQEGSFVPLVLTDFHMTHAITGETVLVALRKQLGDELPMKVILISGIMESGAAREQLVRCRADAFLPKPFEPTILCAMVNEMLSKVVRPHAKIEADRNI